MEKKFYKLGWLDTTFSKTLEPRLLKAGIQTDIFENAEDAILSFTKKRYDLILIHSIAVSRGSREGEEFEELEKILSLNKYKMGGYTCLSRIEMTGGYTNPLRISAQVIKETHEKYLKNKKTKIIGLETMDLDNLYPNAEEIILDAGASDYWNIWHKLDGGHPHDYDLVEDYVFEKIVSTIKSLNN